MIFASILLSAIGTIFLSETLGRGKVVYTRMTTLVGSCALCCAAAGYLVTRQGGGAAEVAAIALSCVPVMGAWLGFRIHVSNSITLELAGLLEDGRPRALREIAEDYDVNGHTARRIEILQADGYLTQDADARVTDTAKSRVILVLTRVLCGPGGPRAVADTLRRRDDGDGVV